MPQIRVTDWELNTMRSKHSLWTLVQDRGININLPMTSWTDPVNHDLVVTQVTPLDIPPYK